MIENSMYRSLAFHLVKEQGDISDKCDTQLLVGPELKKVKLNRKPRTKLWPENDRLSSEYDSTSAEYLFGKENKTDAMGQSLEAKQRRKVNSAEELQRLYVLVIAEPYRLPKALKEEPKLPTSNDQPDATIRLVHQNRAGGEHPRIDLCPLRRTRHPRCANA